MQQSEQKIITCKHSMACGDIISIMAGMKAHYQNTGEKWLVYQVIGLPGIYYEGAIYSTRSETGVPVTMNEHLFRMIKPLIVAQEYIEDFRIYQHQPVDVDFDLMFKMGICNKPWGMIQRWPFYVFANLAINCDLNKPWLTIPEPDEAIKKDLQGVIILNKTERYNHQLSYSFLNEYKGSVAFIGTKQEFQRVVGEHGITPAYLEVENFLQAAQYLSACKVFVGNASLMWNIAEAIKIPRVLEIFPPAQNCIPSGPPGYDAMWQAGMEFYVKHLFNN